MRAAISLLITGLFFSSLAAINSQAPDIHVSNSDSQELMAAIGNTKKSRKDWRGSGRKQLVEHIKSTHPLV
ncbi:MAG: heterocyst-inhibiting protein PatX [Brasilonema sp.]